MLTAEETTPRRQIEHERTLTSGTAETTEQSELRIQAQRKIRNLSTCEFTILSEEHHP